jgi:phospholipid N-methyltransferase
MSILDYTVKKEERYDFVVSGLPLNSFPVCSVADIFDKFKGLTAEGGTLSYFDYLLLPRIKRICLNNEDRENFDSILQMKKDFFCSHGQRMKKVLLNVFPARVLHHRITSSAHS